MSCEIFFDKAKIDHLELIYPFIAAIVILFLAKRKQAGVLLIIFTVFLFVGVTLGKSLTL